MSEQKNRDNEFVKILRDGESSQFELVYDYFHKALFGIIKKIVIDEEQAADVLQDAFIKIWDKRASYDSSKGSLFTWMLNISRNTAIDFTRSKNFKSTAKNRNLEDNVGIINKTSSSQTNTDVIGISEVVETLPADQRQIIDLMYYNGMSQEEIANEYNIPLGTVKTRARSAIGKLRLLFKEGIQS